jgi:pimeloyl-ACP methyl ester carboxylesterase
VLVPGLGLDRRSSERLRRRLAADHVAVDVLRLPGMGRRRVVPSVDELAAQLSARLAQGPVLLVGHSQSCQVVVAAAERDPRIAALVLLGPTTDPRLRSPRALTGRWLRTAVHEPVWQVPLLLAQWLRTGPRAMAALWRSAAPDRIDERLRRVAVPVTVVRGTQDRLCPHDWAATVAAAAPLGRLVEIAGAAHMTVHTHPDAVAGIVWAVLGGGASG